MARQRNLTTWTKSWWTFLEKRTRFQSKHKLITSEPNQLNVVFCDLTAILLFWYHENPVLYWIIFTRCISSFQVSDICFVLMFAFRQTTAYKMYSYIECCYRFAFVFNWVSCLCTWFYRSWSLKYLCWSNLFFRISMPLST